jgi:tetratricopeptide (TPR) repeat protein
VPVLLLAALTVAAAVHVAPPAPPLGEPGIETAFRRMYELRFDEARAEIDAYRKLHPGDSLGAAAEAASYLFEEFNQEGVLTSAFFLDDERFLGGIQGQPDLSLSTAFLAANENARRMALERMKSSPEDPDALFVLTLADGMQGDFEALIGKHQLAALSLIRGAEKKATRLLAVRAETQDAYVALGAANYIIGCLPIYKRVLLWFGAVRGDRQRGMDQLQVAAERGHYLRPFAMALLALAAEREGRFDLALTLFDDLSREFPANTVFASERALAQHRAHPSHQERSLGSF